VSQYPPGQEPWGRPEDPRQRPQHPQQQEQYAPPGGDGGQSPSMPADPQQRRLFQIGGVVAAIVAFVLIVHPFSGAGLTGTWVGPVTMQTQRGTIPVAEILLDLKQDGNNLSGSGQECVNFRAVAQAVSFTVTGSVNGSAVRMTWKLSNGDEPVSGTTSNDQLQLINHNQSATSNATLQHGGNTAFAQSCSRLPQLSNGG
jgi:hypothetical protein